MKFHRLFLPPLIAALAAFVVSSGVVQRPRRRAFCRARPASGRSRLRQPIRLSRRPIIIGVITIAAIIVPITTGIITHTIDPITAATTTIDIIIPYYHRRYYHRFYY